MNKTIMISLMLTLAIAMSAQDNEGQTRLFGQALRDAYPPAPLDYVEHAYSAYLTGDKETLGRYDNIEFLSGSWNSMKQVNDSTPCTIEMLFGRAYMVTWEGVAQLQFPVQYDKLLGGTRSEIEDALIARLKANGRQPRVETPSCFFSELRDKDGLLVLEGETYQIADVNKNVYYIAADDAATTDTLSDYNDSTAVVPRVSLVCDSAYPAQSVANIFICGSRQSIPVTIVIPKHEYGEQETVTTTVETLLQECVADGCEAYWGTENVTDSELRGALFLYNPSLGYDHIVRISCDPRLIGSDSLTMQGRMSLFVPTNNVKDLFHKDNPDARPKVIVYE